MSHRSARPAPLLHRAISRGLAIVAIALQVLFFAEHLGAAAVQAAGTAPPGARMGFLQICTGAGIALYDPATGRSIPQTGTPADHGGCAICCAAAICGFDTPEAAIAPAAPPVTLVATLAPPALPGLGFIEPLSHPGQIRAPPRG